MLRQKKGTKEKATLAAGTGVITRALLAQGIPPQRLVLVENDAVLCRLLQTRFPDVTVIACDAARLTPQLQAREIAGVAAVVSGLPLMAMPETVRQAILRQGQALLPPGAPFIQFTYGPFSPLQRCSSHWHGQRMHHVLGNLPPASIWRYHRPPTCQATCPYC